MSRSGYSDDCENVELYRASVSRALRGQRGQAFLRELVATLDAMPEKALIAQELIDERGGCCAIGAVCKARAIDVSRVDYEDQDSVARKIGVARCMAAEIAYMNDEACRQIETPGERWVRMRKWAAENITSETPASEGK
jgi:hypothetical protein